MLDVVPIGANSCTGDFLATTLATVLTKAGFRPKRVGTIVVDATNVNVGEQKGLVVLFNKHLEAAGHQWGGALVIRCVCHLLHNLSHQGILEFGRAEHSGRSGLNAQLAIDLERVAELTRQHWDVWVSCCPQLQQYAKPVKASLTRWGSYHRVLQTELPIWGMLRLAVTAYLQQLEAAREDAPDWAAEFGQLLKQKHLATQAAIVAITGVRYIDPQLGWAEKGNSMHAGELHRHRDELLSTLQGAQQPATMQQDYEEVYETAEGTRPAHKSAEEVQQHTTGLIQQHLQRVTTYLQQEQHTMTPCHTCG